MVPAFTFAITDDAGGRFKIVNDEVQVANSNLLDYENTTSHTITVQVTEDDSSQTSTQTFTINLNNLDDTDPTQPTLDNLTVDENAANDTVVGTLSSSDPDNIGTAFTFAITDDAGGRFKIVNDEVQVANSNLLDYESTTSHTITVRVTEDDSSQTSTQTFTINLNNLDDTDPTQPTLDNLIVDENAANDTVVGTLSSSDPDNIGTAFTFAITDDAGGRFKIVNDEVQVANSNLLDYESTTSHTITVQVTEDDSSQTSTQTFTINLNNLDDTDPTQPTLDNLTIDENAANDTVVGTLSSSDPDNIGTAFTFAITDDAGGRFKIVNDEVQVANSNLLDYEDTTSHTITVRVTEDDSSQTSTQTFTINLNNLDDTDPTQPTLDNLTVDENAANDTVVGTLSSSDPDGIGAAFTFAITDDAGGRFKIVNDEVQVANSNLLDYESTTSHTITVRVTEDDSSQTSTQTFTISLNNLDDTDPTQPTLDNLTVDENAANDTVVGTLSSSDPDSIGTNFTFAITDDAGGRFKIVNDEVQVANSNLLDYESTTSHTITVQVTEDDSTQTSTQTFTINLNNLDDTDPTQPTLDNLTIDENAANDTVVGTLSSSDPDSIGTNFTFAITDDAGGRFKIVNDEVQVANSNLLDYEDTTSHTITVQVTEDDSSQTSTQTFTINLNNLDDTDPTQPTLDNLTVDENAANDTVVGTLSSSDPDGIGSAFTFAITDDAGGRFKIVNDEVQVANSNLLDYEDTTSHTITVRVTEDDSSQTSTQTFTIDLNNLDDTDPTQPTIDNNTISENAANDTVIGTLSSTYPDAIGNDFTLTLIDDAGGRFKIVNDEVQVANSNLLDYESSTSHAITVRVTEDDSNQTSTQTLTINLSNSDTTPPTEPTLDNTNIDENASNDSIIGTLSSSDPDLIGNSFTFELTDDAGGRFKIVNDEVQVANSNLLDYEDTTSHTITVRVTEDDSSSNQYANVHNQSQQFRWYRSNTTYTR